MPSADEADLRGSETTRQSVDPSELDSAFATGVFTGTGASREAALAALHERLLRIARSELHRRSGHHRITGPELDDLAHQSADDALLAILAKLGQFRGESRFTTWAYGFVILEVSTKLGRHFWRRPTTVLDAAGWDQMPDRFGRRPEEHALHSDLLAAIRRAVEHDLTPDSGRCSWRSPSTRSPWTRWSTGSDPTATRCTRRCSTRGVNCELCSPLTDT